MKYLDIYMEYVKYANACYNNYVNCFYYSL